MPFFVIHAHEKGWALIGIYEQTVTKAFVPKVDCIAHHANIGIARSRIFIASFTPSPPIAFRPLGS